MEIASPVAHCADQPTIACSRADDRVFILPAALPAGIGTGYIISSCVHPGVFHDGGIGLVEPAEGIAAS